MTNQNPPESDPEVSEDSELAKRLAAAVLGSSGGQNKSPWWEQQEGGDENSSNLSSAAVEAKRLAKKPDVSHLKPGTVEAPDGEVYPIFKEGDRIVVERSCSFLKGNPWLDTYVYTVDSIDDETGVVRCREEETDHLATVSFKSPHQRVFLCPKGNPFTETAKKAMAKEKAREPSQESEPSDKKRGRGRPKGSKNRPRDVIVAEKKAKAAAKASKRENRKGARTRR